MEPPKKASYFDNFVNTYFPPQPGVTSLHRATIHSINKLRELFTRGKLTFEQLNHQTTPYRLSALHVAVLKGDEKAVEVLANNGVSLTLQDSSGNTAAHLAAMTGKTVLVNKLRELAKKTGQQFEEIRNCYFATVATLQKITRAPVFELQAVVASVKDGEGNIIPMTAAKYRDRTGTLYCDTVQISPELLCKHWFEAAPKGAAKDLALEQIWEKYLKSKPKVYLEEQVVPGTQIQLGLGLRANETIQPFTLLFPWGGELLDEETPDEASSYKMRNIECLKYSNLACRINDGFPVAVVSKLQVEGCPEGLGVFAAEVLNKDQIITIHYGVHTCKFERYEILHKDKLEKFATRSNFETSLKKMAAVAPKSADDFDTRRSLLGEMCLAPSIYILETPRVFVHLVANKFITAADLEFLENKISETTNIHFLEEGYAGVITNFRKWLIQSCKNLSTTQFNQTYLAFLNTLFAKHRVAVGIFVAQFAIDYSVLLMACLVDNSKFEEGLNKALRSADLLEQILDRVPDLRKEDKKEDAKVQILALWAHFRASQTIDISDNEFLPSLAGLIYGAEISLLMLDLIKKQTP